MSTKKISPVGVKPLPIAIGMRAILLFFPVAICLSALGQSSHGNIGFILPRDKVKLKNGDVETGKIIYSDSSRITLRKYDYSEKNILRKDIDTIMGLSYFTYFL